MTKQVVMQATGVEELKEIFKILGEDFGTKDQRKILAQAVRKSMQPVLMQAKANVPVDTGGLRESLRIEARKPTRKDRRSKYISERDAVISTVTTAPGNVLARRKFYNFSESYKQKKDVYTTGIESDARAIAQEFGTSHNAPQPFMRSALESQSPTVLSTLAKDLKFALERYKARQAKKANKI